jgi:predicted dehydrogenase
MTRAPLRLALLGVSHWHLELYLEPLTQEDSVKIVGVSDPNPQVARHLGIRLGCDWSPDFRDLCDKVKPDFVFAFGRHCDMADEGRFLIERGIPFVMEKPCGLNSSEVSDLNDLAVKRGAFAAVPFVWRQSELLKMVEANAPGETFSLLSFRLIAGPPSRYPADGCEWMLDPAQSGGGCTINLAVHFIDLFRFLHGTQSRVDLLAAVMANDAFGLPIEDYSVLVLAVPGGRCLIETGYLYPARAALFDMRFSMSGETHYIVASDAETIELSDRTGGYRIVQAKTTNVPHYPGFVTDVLARWRGGQAPQADLGDMLAVMDVVDRAYALGGVDRKPPSGYDVSG